MDVRQPASKARRYLTWTLWILGGLIIALFLVVAGGWLVFWVAELGWPVYTLEGDKLERAALLSESFVAAHAFAEFVGVVLVGVTLIMMRQELSHHDRAIFQASFFPYLSVFNQYVASLSQGSLEGRDCLSEIKEGLARQY